MKRGRRALFPLTAILLVLGAGCWIQSRASARDKEWGEVTREDFVLGIEVSGTLKAVESDILGPPPIPNMWDFKIALMAPEGSEVKKGRPVLGFDTSQLARELEEKRAGADAASKEIEKTEADVVFQREKDGLALAETQARLRKTSLKLEAPVELIGANERRRSEVERSLAEREASYLRRKTRSSERAAREQLAIFRTKERRAAERVREIEGQIARMTVKAPRDGTVIHVANWRSDKKKVGDSCWRDEKVLEIPDLSRMMGRGEVDEADAGRVSVGQRARLRLDAHPDKEFAGSVTSIAKTVARQSPRNPLKVLRLDLSLDLTDREKMKPGMRFRGTIERERVTNAVVVPLEAVFPSEAGPVAYRKTLFSLREVSLRLGRRNGRLVEVRSGLSAGDRVLLERGPRREDRKS